MTNMKYPARSFLRLETTPIPVIYWSSKHPWMPKKAYTKLVHYTISQLADVSHSTICCPALRWLPFYGPSSTHTHTHTKSIRCPATLVVWQQKLLVCQFSLLLSVFSSGGLFATARMQPRRWSPRCTPRWNLERTPYSLTSSSTMLLKISPTWVSWLYKVYMVPRRLTSLLGPMEWVVYNH